MIKETFINNVLYEEYKRYEKEYSSQREMKIPIMVYPKITMKEDSYSDDLLPIIEYVIFIRDKGFYYKEDDKYIPIYEL